MRKTIRTLCAALISSLLIFSAGMAYAGDALADDHANMAKPIVKNFVLCDETFAYDGMKETLTIEQVTGHTEKTGMLQAVDTSEVLKYKVKFSCRHTGYGDRRGMILGQAITHHDAIITLEDNAISSAVMDGEWDMLNEEFLV